MAVAAAVRSTENLYGPKPDSQLKVVILRVYAPLSFKVHWNDSSEDDIVWSPYFIHS